MARELAPEDLARRVFVLTMVGVTAVIAAALILGFGSF